MNNQRHAARCNVCKHEDREEIEKLYLSNVPNTRISQMYEGITVHSLGRHIAALNLDEKRAARRKARLGDLVAMLSDAIDETTIADLPAKEKVALLLKAEQEEARLRGEIVEKKQKVAAEIQEIQDELEGKSQDELEFYSLHKRWPEPGEMTEGTTH